MERSVSTSAPAPDSAAAPAPPEAALPLATRLARCGRLDAAESLLAAAAGADPRVLDLQARICSQRGRLGEAEALWLRALELAPGTPAFVAALWRVRRLQRRQPALDRALAAAALVIGAAGLYAGTAFRSPPAVGEAGTPSAHGVTRAERSCGEAAPGMLTALAPRLEVAGFTWHHKGEELVGEYHVGLFDHGTHFRRGAARALTLLGQRLAAAPHGLELRVVGTTDDLPLARGSRYADNLDLGLARGVAVAGRLRRTAPLDSTIVWVSGGVSGAMAAAEPHRHGRSATLQLRATPASP